MLEVSVPYYFHYILLLGGAKGSGIFINNIYWKKLFFYILKFTSWIKYLMCDSEASNKQGKTWNLIHEFEAVTFKLFNK